MMIDDLEISMEWFRLCLVENEITNGDHGITGPLLQSIIIVLI